MSRSTPTAPITPDEMLHLRDAKRYELIGGRLVERRSGMEAGYIGARIAFLVGAFVRDRKLGHLFDCGASFQCFPAALEDVLRPSLSFIRAGRFEGERLPQGHCRIAPDLAVEVISPGKSSYEIDEIVAAYLAAGVQLVWVVHPPTHHVRIHHPPSTPLGIVSELSDKDTITGEDVLPGFSCAVADFFA